MTTIDRISPLVTKISDYFRDEFDMPMMEGEESEPPIYRLGHPEWLVLHEAFFALRKFADRMNLAESVIEEIDAITDTDSPDPSMRALRRVLSSYAGDRLNMPAAIVPSNVEGGQ